MFVVLGANGNVGSALVRTLAAVGHQVLAVVRSKEKAKALDLPNVEPVSCDVRNTGALRAVFQRGRRAFLLNPPGDPSGDANADELETARTITDALANSGLEKLVLASTYGAQPGERIGDLSTLYEFEQQARAAGIPLAINRGAYYFTNLDMLLATARESVLPTAFPAEFKLPMVAPVDLARAAAERLVSPPSDLGTVYVEGPDRYSFGEVAAAFSRHLGREVIVETTPRDAWEASFEAVGFSPASARSFARMIAATIDTPDLPEAPWRGEVTLDNYVAALVRSAG